MMYHRRLYNPVTLAKALLRSSLPVGACTTSTCSTVPPSPHLHCTITHHHCTIGGTMWGNWSTTVRRTRLTPSYANSANLASDSIVYNPKYTTIAKLQHVLQQYTETILHTKVTQ